MKRLKSRHTGVIFGYDATMALSTNDYEVIEEAEAPTPAKRKTRKKRAAKPKTEPVVETKPTIERDELDDFCDGLENL